jgi:hypothetical protein
VAPKRVDEGERTVSRQVGPICRLEGGAINTIRAMIDRAARDRDFMCRLARDPIGTAYAEGYAISTHELKQLLGLGKASDAEVVTTLQIRLGDIAEHHQ